METDRELLIVGLQELKIEPSDIIISRFRAYLHELKKWNRAYNLTALKNNRDIIIKHFLDSLLYLKGIHEGQWSLCDVGSGAGFPGLPIAIVRPDLKICLIEPSRKKTAFLKNMKKMLGLGNVEILESRIEEVKEIFFDIAVTRALFSISDFVKKAGHVLKKDGFLLLNKGPKIAIELEKLPAHIKYEIISAALPMSSSQRSIIKVFIK